jgi:internalin A
LPPHPEIVVDYKHLLNLESLGEESFIPEGLSERVNVKYLLDGVVPEEERRSAQSGVSYAMKDKSGPEPAQPVNSDGADIPSSSRNNPWRSGSFYLLVFVVVMATLVTASNYMQWYAMPLVLIAALLAIPLVGVLQALNDGTLTEKGFLKVVLESYKRLPLLRGK